MPGGSLPLVVGVLLTINVPAEAIAIILGIDRFLDMCRSALNVTDYLVIATIVAKGENPTARSDGARHQGREGFRRYIVSGAPLAPF